MADVGKLLILFGIVLAIFGVVLLIAGRAHLPIGRLPGDIVYRGKNTVFYFPLGTSILFSIVLSLVFYLIARLRG